jgi:hypothetical protein
LKNEVVHGFWLVSPATASSVRGWPTCTECRLGIQFFSPQRHEEHKGKE